MRKYNEFTKSGQSTGGKLLLECDQQQPQQHQGNLTSANRKKSAPKRAKKRITKETAVRENLKVQNQYKSNETQKINDESVLI